MQSAWGRRQSAASLDMHPSACAIGQRSGNRDILLETRRRSRYKPFAENEVTLKNDARTNRVYNFRRRTIPGLS